MGNETVKKVFKINKRNGKRQQLLEYSFAREHCRNYPRRAECIGKSRRIARILRIGINTPELYGYSQRAKKPEFLKEYRKRAKIEPKNAELKRFHGLNRARGYEVSAFKQNLRHKTS